MVSTKRIAVVVRSLFHIHPPDLYGKSARVRVVSGEYSGREGLFSEVRRMICDGTYGPGRMLPVDLIEGPHVHLQFEEVEWLESPVKEWSEAL